jgi:hypothetical protein
MEVGVFIKLLELIWLLRIPPVMLDVAVVFAIWL